MTSVFERLRLGSWRLWPPLLIAAGVFVVLLAVATRYGYHRDELYFVAASERMAWGYVDQPPLTVGLAWLTGALFDHSLFWLRVWPAVALAATVTITGLVTKRLGGNRFAQTVAAAGIGGGGFFLGAGHLLSTATFDYLVWAVLLLLLVHLLDGGDQRWWLVFGAVAGIGLLNKHTVLFLIYGVLVGLLVTKQRRLLATRWPWLGAGIAVLVWSPNVLWQAANGFPTLEMTANLRERLSGVGASFEILALQVVAVSFVFIVPAMVGLVWLLRKPEFSAWRPLGVAYGLLLAQFVVVGGRFYYVAGLYVVLLAVGGIWLERRYEHKSKRGVALAGIVAVAAALPFALPLAPASGAALFNALNKELGETVGWQELVEQVTAAGEILDPDQRESATILTSNYGQAGALELLGDNTLPPVVSGHNNYWLWGPRRRDGAVIAVGYFGGFVDALCATPVVDAGVVVNDAGLGNDEQGSPIRVCRETRIPLAAAWDDAKHFD